MKDFKRNPKLYLDTVKQILVNGENVPSLPALVGQLQHNLNDISFQQLDDTLQQDPNLTAVVLKTANSALYKRPVPISSLQDGIATLGLSTVKSLLVAHQLKGLFKIQDSKLTEHLKERWIRTQRFAACCKKLAGLLDMDTETIYLSALLSDLGSGLIAQEFTRFQRKEDPPLFNWIADHYAHLISAHLISAHLLQRWKFDESVWFSIKKKGQWNYKSRLTIESVDILNMCWLHVLNDESTPELQDIPRFWNIPASIRLLASPRQFFLLKDY